MKIVVTPSSLPLQFLYPSIPRHHFTRLSPPRSKPVRTACRQFQFPPSFNPASSIASSVPFTFTAQKTLPYAAPPLYDIIADISSYHYFLPYCSASRILQWSDPDTARGGRRWPMQGELTVGYGGFEEQVRSRVVCDPGKGTVEALGGDEGRDGQAQIFKKLRTKWSLLPLGGKETEVDLSLEYAFANPVYTALSSAVQDKVAGAMIKAFERRAKEILG